MSIGQRAKGRPLELVLVIPFVIIVGSYTVLAIVGAARDARYPSTEATLEEVKTWVSGAERKGGPFTYVLTRYRYTVDNKIHIGSRYMIGMPIFGDGDLEYRSFSKANAADGLARIRGTPTFPAYYDPDDPSESILERRAFSEAYFPGVLALAGLVYSLVRLKVLRPFWRRSAAT